MAEPRSSLLALPLVLLFFSIFGLRAAFAIPTDVDANWPFRMSEPGLAATLDATRAVMLAVAVLPVGLLALIAAWSAGWPVATAVSVALCDVVSGILLVECVLYRWSKVPFTCAHAPAQETLTSRWPFFILALNVFAFQLALFQLTTLQSRWGAVSYVFVIGAGAVAVRISRDRTLRHATVQFEAPSEGLLTLGLSEAAQ